MANVILPIAMYFFPLGGTMNMFNYESDTERDPIFRHSDFIKLEKQKVTLNSTYYILQDDRLPYSAMGLPVDLLLRVKSKWHPLSVTYDIPWLVHRNPIHDAVALVIITEQITGKLVLRQSSVPVTEWQKSVPDTSTHYVEEVIFGGKCIAKVEVKSSVPGDVQIIRRIFAEVMGTSGHFPKEDVHAYTEVWKFAMRAAQESPDVRGHVYVDDFDVKCTNIDPPFEALHSFENFLEHLPNISFRYLGKDYQTTLYVGFQSLHSLDQRYPPVEINKQSEEYLTSLDVKLDDLKRVYMDGHPIPITEEDTIIKEEFWKKAGAAKRLLLNLPSREMSIYKSIDVERFDNAFQQYKAGLDEGDKNYCSAWKKLIENTEMECGRKFLSPTSGLLVANDDEVVYMRSVKEGPRACKQYCRIEPTCRAIGYDDSNPDMCRVYAVSTNTAVIYSTEEVNFMKIYDRQCHKIGG